VDANGFVQNISSSAWSDLIEEVAKLGGEACKFLDREGYCNSDMLVKELENLHSKDAKVEKNIRWFESVAKKCEDIIIVTNGQENVIEMDLLENYKQAQDRVIAAGYQDEIKWCRDLEFEKCTSDQFFDEYVWCVLNAGMKEQVSRKIYDKFMQGRDLNGIGHHGKREAVKTGMKKYIQWFEELRCSKDPIEYLQTLPYIGKVTKYHLARNIGIDCVKPDRHMVRLAENFGFKNPLEMCLEIQKHIPHEKLGTIDVILWRDCNLRQLKTKD